jgi:methyl-accepting chemotaxis protein
MSPTDITAEADPDTVVENDLSTNSDDDADTADPELLAIVREATGLQELTLAWSRALAGEVASARGTGDSTDDGAAVTCAAVSQGIAQSIERLAQAMERVLKEVEQLRRETRMLRREVERLTESREDLGEPRSKAR